MENTVDVTTYGCQSMVTPVRRMLLKDPRAAWRSQERVDAQWQALNYLARPDFDAALAEYDALMEILARVGMELAWLPSDDATSLDSVYAHDPLIVANRGAILGRMGKAARAPEPATAGAYLESIGVPVLGRIEAPGKLEGGDVVWMDERTLAIGQGYRTNAEGIHQVREMLGNDVDEIIPVPMPHWTGPADCLHLMSFISLVDHDLAVVYSRLMPVPFREWLLEREVRLVEVPDEEYDSFGCNVLAVAPGVCVMIDGNPVTRQRLEKAGAEVHVYPGANICIKGGGGPTCLTRPIWRG
ncbi:MAG: arginine deiminase family protein [Anaerolineae bacterium]